MKKVLGILCVLLIARIANASNEMYITNNGIQYSCMPIGQQNTNEECKGSLDVFKRTLNTCVSNYHGFEEAIGVCVKNNFPQLRTAIQSNASCLYKASGECNEICVKNYDGFEEKTVYCSNVCK
jgi:hypothetical protein